MLLFPGYFVKCENRGVVGTQVCTNHIHDMGNFILFKLKFSKQTKVLERETKLRKINSTYS